MSQFVNRLLARWFQPLIQNILDERENSLRQDLQKEFQRVGVAVREIQNRTAASPTDPTLSFINARVENLERILEEATQPVKPGNHIRPGHSFGNQVRL